MLLMLFVDNYEHMENMFTKYKLVFKPGFNF